MCRIAFRNSKESFCLCNHPHRTWCELRYVIEQRAGMHHRCDSVLFGFLKADWKNRIALHDDYTVQSNDIIIVLRCPLSHRCQVWSPPSVRSVDMDAERDYADQQHAEHVRTIKDPKKRLHTILEYSKQRRQVIEPPPHPCHRIASSVITSWRTNDEEAMQVQHPPTTGSSTYCQRCMNLLPHADNTPCPTSYELPTTWRWLSKCRPPTGIPIVCRTKVERPSCARDLQHVEWVDSDGIPWRRKQITYHMTP